MEIYIYGWGLPPGGIPVWYIWALSQLFSVYSRLSSLSSPLYIYVIYNTHITLSLYIYITLRIIYSTVSLYSTHTHTLWVIHIKKILAFLGLFTVISLQSESFKTYSVRQMDSILSIASPDYNF